MASYFYLNSCNAMTKLRHDTAYTPRVDTSQIFFFKFGEKKRLKGRKISSFID